MMGRWINRIKNENFQKTAKMRCAESAETPFCTNCTDDPARYSENLDAHFTRFCNRLSLCLDVPYEWLAAHYFTPEDLLDIKRGVYCDPEALAELIKSDFRYPFGWLNKGARQ